MDDNSSHENKRRNFENKKQEQLDQYRKVNTGKPMTTNQGRKISGDQNQLKVGARSPSLHEDQHYFEN